VKNKRELLPSWGLYSNGDRMLSKLFHIFNSQCGFFNDRTIIFIKVQFYTVQAQILNVQWGGFQHLHTPL
jgi:hypothetical protein